MDYHQRQVLEAVDTIIQERLKYLKFNYVVEGRITGIVSTTSYRVEIDDIEYVINSINGQTYQLEDIVYILIVNNDFSNKLILCKRP